MEQIFPFILPVVLALLTGGGLTGYFVYRGNKPKTEAEAKRINADVIVTFADGWEKYAKTMENRMSEMEIRYEKRISDLEKLIEDKDKAHAKVVLEKDRRIDELEDRVNYLEEELERYQRAESKVEIVKENLHQSVDENLDQMKKL